MASNSLTSKLVVSLIDRTKGGAKSVVRNMSMMKSAASGVATAIGQTTQAARKQGRTMRAFRTIGGHTPGAGSIGASAGAFGFLSNEFKSRKR